MIGLCFECKKEIKGTAYRVRNKEDKLRGKVAVLICKDCIKKGSKYGRYVKS